MLTLRLSPTVNRKKQELLGHALYDPLLRVYSGLSRHVLLPRSALFLLLTAEELWYLSQVWVTAPVGTFGQMNHTLFSFLLTVLLEKPMMLFFHKALKASDLGEWRRRCLIARARLLFSVSA